MFSGGSQSRAIYGTFEKGHVMRRLLRRLWDDDQGALQTTEWVFLATLLVLGLIPGIVAVRDALNVALTNSARLACAGMSGCSVCSTASVQADQVSMADQSPCD